MKLKYLFTEIDERLLGREFPLMSVSKIRGVVSRAELADDEGRAVSIENYKLCQPGDLVINRMAAYQGALGIAFVAGAVSPDYTILRGPAELTRFLYFFLKSSIGIALVTSLLKGIGSVDSGSVRTPRLNWRDLGDIEILFAPVEELSKATDLLERQTLGIDRLIVKKEQLIEKLLERRQALITHVVTKGLDPNAPMKDSGIEWLGKAPASWTVRPHWSVMRESKTPVGNLHSELDLLSLTKQGVIVRDLEGGGKFPANFESYQQVQVGDLILCLFDVEETPRTVGLAPAAGMITSAYTVMRISDVHPSFLEWYLIGMDNEKRFKPFYSGLRNTISKDVFGSIRFAMPPLDEQKAIVSYLNKETSQIDHLLAKTITAINLLKERRQALITQVVTGKIDVRGFAGGNS